ncbi:hypothetical protein D9758_017103 [Tetrapyrgos nigripes]|uniref:FAD dependent oxidoreductase domain-containing protein n=1 Tax=Tetrapyrgos nigripes TaxID=182062 RepID=A0A8H5FER2_9AGAR|nr:hypothetical protein D9758_017103 [Tetrapyrgos nigripes]
MGRKARYVLPWQRPDKITDSGAGFPKPLLRPNHHHFIKTGFLSIMPPTVVIIGSGVTGLSVALALPRTFRVTIVARDHVGDNQSKKWASPWAGAGCLPWINTSEDDINLQKSSLRYLWKLAATDPESSVRVVTNIAFWEKGTSNGEKPWFEDFMVDCRELPPSDLPEGVTMGHEFKTLTMNPQVYLFWLKNQLQVSGNVKFVRRELNHISEVLDCLPKDVSKEEIILVNATGCGAKYLGGVKDSAVQEARGQTMLVKSPLTTVYVRSGEEYAYAIPRGDGTVVLGGISQINNTDTSVDPELKHEILRRVNRLTPPGTFPAKVEDLDLVEDITGVRPGRAGGVRLERELIKVEGQGDSSVSQLRVVHAYGMGGGGYKYSAWCGDEGCSIGE